MKIRAHRRRPVRTALVVESLEAKTLLSQAGALDPTFGTQGSITLTPPSATNLLNQGAAVAVQPDGKIILLEEGTGSSAQIVERLNADGSIDTTFGTDGIASIFPNNSTFVGSMALQPNGQIVVAGFTYPTAVTGIQGIVERLNADGSPDTTFGTSGNGIVTLGDGAEPDAMTDIDSILPGPNGTILLAGSPPDSGGDFSLLRLNSNGSLDTSFGVNGLADANLGSQVYGAAIQPDGKIVEVGSEVYKVGSGGMIPPMYTEVVAVRFNSDGSLDTSFGGPAASSLSVPGTVVLSPVVTPESGGVPTAAARSIAIEPDGKFILGGDDGGEVSVIRLDANGVPDTSFGNNDGREVIDPPAPVSDENIGSVEDAKITPGGKIVVLVSAGEESGTTPPQFLVQLNPDGSIDSSFGDTSTPGEASTGNVTGGAMAIQADGKILVTGSDDVRTSTGNQFLAVVDRFLDPIEAVPADYDGSGQTDLALYLPSLGEFAYRPTTGSPDVLVPFGLSGTGQTIPAPGDYTQAGQTEIAAYLPSLGVYAIRPADGGADEIIPFGIAGLGQSIPAPADYQGTGLDNLAVYLPSVGSFAIRSLTGGPDEIIPFGFSGADQTIPAPGDYFGTGQDDIAAYLPSIGAFAIRNPAGGPDEIIPFGLSGIGQSIPVPGDYDGSGQTEIAVYMPSLGLFAYRPADGGPDVIISFGAAGSGAIPVPGDYDGSGKTEIAIYDPNNGNFAYRPADGGPDVIIPFGLSGVGQSLPLAIQPAALQASLPSMTTTVQAMSSGTSGSLSALSTVSVMSMARQSPKVSVLVANSDPFRSNF